MSNESTIETKHNGKIVLVYDKSVQEHFVVPLFCPICSFQMKTMQDSLSYRKMKCCNKCEIYWGYKKEVDFSDEEKLPKILFAEEWDEYIKNREISSRPILIFK